MMSRTRLPGPDTLRALAIVLVFGYHYRVFVGPAPALGWLGSFGWVGVDLFFVLSGYLISGLLLGEISRTGRLNLGFFWARRALRTWPAFWLALVAYQLWPAELGGRTPLPWWRFASFTQNWGLLPGTAFSHAWSLCIEEQFYLLLPLLATLWLACGARRRWAWLGLAALLLIGILSRALLWQVHGREAGVEGGMGTDGYYPAVYYATLCRFDEFLPGVGLALLQHRHPELWARLMRQGAALGWAALLACGAVLAGLVQGYYIPNYGYGAFMSIAGYSLVAGAFALLLAAALSPTCALSRWRVPGAAELARWSYAIYLSHKAVAHGLRGALAPLGWPPLASFTLIALTSVAVGALLYTVIEAPCLALRERWFGRR